MGEQKRAANINRRDFIKALGLMSGAALTRPVLSENELLLPAQQWSNFDETLRIGVLLPPSRFYPKLGQNLLAGMRLFFVQNRLPVKFFVEEIGFGWSEALRKSTKLLNNDHVHLVVGAVNPDVVPHLRDLYEDRQRVFIASNAGENVVPSAASHPLIFHHSLGYWQANQALGAWAAENLGQKAFIVSSLYDSGYDALATFRNGFEQAGGQVSQVYISHTNAKTDRIETTFDEIRKSGADFVYALYCGKPAVEFVQAYAASGLAGKIPLAGSGFLVEDYVLTSQARSALGIWSALSWAGRLDNPENQVFLVAYQIQNGRPADIFAVLGFDTARLIAEGVETAGGDLDQTDRLVAALEMVRFNGPRGLVTVDPGAHIVSTPLYLRQVAQEVSLVFNQVISELPPPLAAEKTLAAIKSGWLNAYLSA